MRRLVSSLLGQGSSEDTTGTTDGHRFFGRDRAVSPIVATIILIALVVVMGGVVASMVFGFGSGTQQTPHAKFTFQYKKSSNTVIVRDTGGPKLTSSNTLSLTVNDTSNGAPSGSHTTWYSGGSGSVGAGGQTSIKVNPGDHVVVDWTGPNGKNTATLGKFNVPG